MQPTTRRGFRNLLLSSIYALGVFGILASGDGDNDVVRAFTCGLSIQGIAPVGDGTVWVGVFAKTNSDTEDRVVLLDTDGSELESYLIGNGGSENAIRAIARATDGSNDVYVGGDFIRGISRGILRLNSDGSLDTDFDVGTGFNGRVTAIVPLTNGQVYVAGYFTEFGVDSVSGLVRLNSDGSWDNAGFITVPGVTDIDSVVLGTDAPFVDYLYSGGTGLNQLSRWESNGIRDGAFNPIFGPVFSVVPAADSSGNIYYGGRFTNNIIRLTEIGTTDMVFNVGTGFDNDVLSIDRAASGGIYVGGDFTTYDVDNSNGIARINGNGTLDGSFMVGSGFTDPNGIFPFSKVASVIQDTSGSDDVFVGGGFTEYNGVPSNGIVRLDTVGSPAAFNVSINIDGEVCNSQTIPDS
ncbi:MAG: hypothetical protein OES20_18190 [Gammaproteobacteria bacterium]|nr:hypothetical protein [Gammaproteobacteria bacterium]